MTNKQKTTSSQQSTNPPTVIHYTQLYSTQTPDSLTEIPWLLSMTEFSMGALHHQFLGLAVGFRSRPNFRGYQLLMIQPSLDLNITYSMPIQESQNWSFRTWRQFGQSDSETLTRYLPKTPPNSSPKCWQLPGGFSKPGGIFGNLMALFGGLVSTAAKLATSAEVSWAGFGTDCQRKEAGKTGPNCCNDSDAFGSCLAGFGQDSGRPPKPQKLPKTPPPN